MTIITKIQKLPRLYLSIVVILVLVITLYLSWATYHINYWPTDSFTPYIPTAAKLFKKPFLSQMHEIPTHSMHKVTMRGKETLILGIAVMQRILGDFKSLYPNVLFLLLCLASAAVMIYLIFKKLFNAHIGFIIFLLFITSFWGYLYVLQGAHQPLVLLCFLLASFFILFNDKKRKSYYFLSGIFLGLMLFSSPTAPLYLPYFIALFVYQEIWGKPPTEQRKWKSKIRLLLTASILIFFVFTYPSPLKAIQYFIHFIRFSQYGNNFVLHHEYLQRFLPLPDQLKGGGVIWVIRYFFHIMPFLFSVYLFGLVYLFKRSTRKPALTLLLLLSLSTPIAVEIIGVAQHGRNYFSWIIGLLLITGLTIHFLSEEYIQNKMASHSLPRFVLILGITLFIGHVGFNLRLFFNDILPARLATTHLYNWLVKNDIQNLYIYQYHPRNLKILPYLKNPKLSKKIYTQKVVNIRQALDGYIFVPPITGRSIYDECRLADFAIDPYLTELWHSQEFSKYVVAKFKTFATSTVWNQEEEICTYLDLVLRGIHKEDREKGYIFILDAKKLQEEWFSHLSKPLLIR